MPSENITIFQWNCRAISKRIDYFTQYLSKEDHHILLLQSLFCSRSKLPKLPGYYYPPLIDHLTSTKHVNVAIYIRDDLEYQCCKSPVPLDSDNVFSAAITLKINDKESINLASVYYPRGPSNTNCSWLKEMNVEKELWVIGGDFNCHSKLWDKGTNKSNSNKVFCDNVIDSNLILLNNGNVTRIPDALNQSPSALDLTFVSPELAIDQTWEIIEDTMGSDHLPIVTTLQQKINIYLEEDTIPKYKYDKADWNTFRNVLDNTTNPFNGVCSNDIDQIYLKFVKSIHDAAKLSIPIKRNLNQTKKTGNIWWTDKCEEAVKEKNKALRIYLKNKKNKTENDFVKNEKRRLNILFFFFFSFFMDSDASFPV